MLRVKPIGLTKIKSNQPKMTFLKRALFIQKEIIVSGGIIEAAFRLN